MNGSHIRPLRVQATRRHYADLVARSPRPPTDTLDRPITRDDVNAYPVYFIHGPGRTIAQDTLCDHNYSLVDSCPCCSPQPDPLATALEYR